MIDKPKPKPENPSGKALDYVRRLIEEGNPLGEKLLKTMKPSKRKTSLEPEQTQEQLMLPDVVPKTPGETSPLSNYLARTPLFAPIKRGRRAMLDKARLPSPAGFSVHYSGKQLDMGDQDVFLLAVKMAAGRPPGEDIEIHRKDFLKALGWQSFSDRAYKWLGEVFDRLSTGRVFLESDEIKASLPLLGALILHKDKGVYTFSIPKETMAIFAGQAFGYINLTPRRALAKRVDLAKWVQGYAMSHKPGPHKVSVANLKEWSGYTAPVRKFREGLTEALDELTRVCVISSWSFKERLKFVCWNR